MSICITDGARFRALEPARVVAHLKVAGYRDFDTMRYISPDQIDVVAVPPADFGDYPLRMYEVVASLVRVCKVCCCRVLSDLEGGDGEAAILAAARAFQSATMALAALQSRGTPMDTAYWARHPPEADGHARHQRSPVRRPRRRGHGGGRDGL